jgi:hypothetical protein
MSSLIKVFEYLGEGITFRDIKGNLMVNATQMAKKFDCKPVDWLKTQPAIDFIACVSAEVNIITSELVKTVKGGNPELQGTWMHEDVAFEFARWLSPEFGLWCNRMVKKMIVDKIESKITPIEEYKYSLKMANYEVKLMKGREKSLKDQILIKQIENNVAKISSSLLLPEGTIWNEAFDQLKEKWKFDVYALKGNLSRIDCCAKHNKLIILSMITDPKNRDCFI